MIERHFPDQVRDQPDEPDVPGNVPFPEADTSQPRSSRARVAAPATADGTRTAGVPFRPHGPYVTCSEALADAEYIYALAAGHHPADKVNENALHDALVSAAVDLGAYDWQVAEWLSTCRSQTVLVVLSWIERAYASGYGAGRQSAYESMRGPQAHYVVDGVTAKCGAIELAATSNPDDATCPACLFALLRDGDER